MKFPFEVCLSDIRKNPDPYVDAVFASLESEFLVLPKGSGFVEYPVFEKGYQALKRATDGFSSFDSVTVFSAVLIEPISLIVLRAMLGFSPPEWAYVASQRTRVPVSQGFVRNLDRKIRIAPEKPINISSSSEERLKALVDTACELLQSSAPSVSPDQLHRLDKADTKQGAKGIRNLSRIGVPYAMLLYERFLGRPFAGHRDSVSELIGDGLESAIEEILANAEISFRKTKRAERIDGFDQTPDFIVPDEFNPQVVIEAKITEDDGTARDKVTRIQHLAALGMDGRKEGDPKFEVIACIGGRGFGVRREDMKKMLIATRGKVFTAKTLNRMIDNTSLGKFRS